MRAAEVALTLAKPTPNPKYEPNSKLTNPGYARAVGRASGGPRHVVPGRAVVVFVPFDYVCLVCFLFLVCRGSGGAGVGGFPMTASSFRSFLRLCIPPSEMCLSIDRSPEHSQ